MIFRNLDSGVAQSLQILPAHFLGALRIENGVHFYSGLGALGQRLGELMRDFAVPECISLEVNRMFGRSNCAEHSRENLIPVNQGGDVVARDKIWSEQ